MTMGLDLRDMWMEMAHMAEERLAEAERAIESAGRCLVLSNNGPREALEILRGYKRTATYCVTKTGAELKRYEPAAIDAARGET